MGMEDKPAKKSVLRDMDLADHRSSTMTGIRNTRLTITPRGIRFGREQDDGPNRIILKIDLSGPKDGNYRVYQYYSLDQTKELLTNLREVINQTEPAPAPTVREAMYEDLFNTLLNCITKLGERR
jgi:hypothetical protein